MALNTSLESLFVFGIFCLAMIQGPKKNDTRGKVNLRRLPLISEEEKAQVRALRYNGVLMKDIGGYLGMSLSSVKRILRSAKNRFLRKTKMFKPRKITEAIRKKIVDMVESNRKMPPGEVLSVLKADDPNFSCSTRTIQNVLIKAGLHGRVCLKKPLLRPQNKVKRVLWARKHKNWRKVDWKNVLWSDEKKFELFNSKRRQYCRRRVGEALRDDTIQATVKHGGGSLMFWGLWRRQSRRSEES